MHAKAGRQAEGIRLRMGAKRQKSEAGVSTVQKCLCLVPLTTRQTEMSRSEGLVLVRRFTDSLQGETMLERATISAQEKEVATERADRRMLLQSIYRDAEGDPR
jgi:hypothetical protein